jgi:hypothetical protein
MSTLIRRRGHHQEEAFFGSRELRNVVIRMGPADVLLHGAIPFLLYTYRQTLILQSLF